MCYTGRMPKPDLGDGVVDQLCDLDSRMLARDVFREPDGRRTTTVETVYTVFDSEYDTRVILVCGDTVFSSEPDRNFSPESAMKHHKDVVDRVCEVAGLLPTRQSTRRVEHVKPPVPPALQNTTETIPVACASVELVPFAAA